MIDDKNSCVVLGEASESEEEDNNIQHENQNKSIPSVVPKAIITGEASESENEVEDDYSITAAAFKSKAEEVQYNSLLHKKLRESNAKLKEDMNDLVQNSLKFASDQVNDINQRLLTNQIEIQETIKHLKRSSVSSMKLDSALSSIITKNYLTSINVNHIS